MKQFCLVLAALSLAGCASTTASLSPEQCAADWRSVGYADGSDGEEMAKLAEYRDACSRGGAPLSLTEEQDWLDGWSAARGHAAPEVYEAENTPRGSASGDGSWPRVTPSIGVGVGSGGVNVGAGVGIGLGSFGLGLYY